MPSATRPAAGRFKARAVRAFTLRVPAEEIYDFIRDPARLARVIQPPVAIKRSSPKLLVFNADDGGGEPVEWEVAVTAEQPAREITWECRHDGRLTAAGAVTLQAAPGDEGTEFRVVLEYTPRGGRLGSWLSRHHPAGLPHALNECLRRTKALLEAGEIPTTEGQPTGAAKRKAKGAR